MILAMATVTTDDGVRLHVEDVGSGTPIVFVHEWAGDLRSYEPQLRHYSRSHRCVAYNARGYQTIATAALAVIPNTGHAVNTEEPDAFNRLVGYFLRQVEAGRWPRGDPRAVTTTIYGR